MYYRINHRPEKNNVFFFAFMNEQINNPFHSYDLILILLKINISSVLVNAESRVYHKI